MKSITLLGSSTGRNAGDAALLSGIMEAIDDACDDRILYEIPTMKPEFVWKNYSNRVRPISVMPWDLSIKLLGLPTLRSLLRTDLSLIFDATLFDTKLYNPLFNFLSSYYLLLPFAKKRGKKMAFFNVTAGPVSTVKGVEMLVELAEMMDFITVRDEDSYDILRDLGVKNPRILVTADSALNAPSCDETRAEAIIASLGLSIDQPILGININKYLDSWGREDGKSLGREAFLDIYKKALNKVIDNLGVQVLFICTQHSDMSITNELMRVVKSKVKKAIISNINYSHYELKGVLGKVSFIYGMRLHCLILASSVLTPIGGLAYLPKVEHYYNTLGIKEYCLPLSRLSEETLGQYILKGWEQRSEIRNVLSSRIPILKRNALLAARLVKTFLTGENVDKVFEDVKNQLSSGAEIKQ